MQPRDIDLLVQKDDLDRAKAALAVGGFTLEGLPSQFNDGMQVQRVNKVDTQGQIMTVDLMVVDETLEPVWATRVRLPFADRNVTVVSRDGLIAMKARAARPQDIADIQNLKDIDR